MKAELDRLKGDPTGQKKGPAAPEPTSMSASKGSITLQELRLPLKADFACSTANKPGRLKMNISNTFVNNDNNFLHFGRNFRIEFALDTIYRFSRGIDSVEASPGFSHYLF